MSTLKNLSGVLAACLFAAATGQAAQTAGVAELYESGEEATWVFEQSGETIGHCISRYNGPRLLNGVGSQHFESWVRLDVPLPGGRFEQDLYGELWTDDAGNPLVFRYHSMAGDVYTGIDLTFDGEEVRGYLQQAGMTKRRKLKAAAETNALANNFVGHLELILARAAPLAGETAKVDVFSVNMLGSLGIEFTHVEDFVDELHGPGSVYQDSLGERLRWTRSGRLLEVAIPAQNLVLRRTTESLPRRTLTRPAVALRPKDLDAEEVVVEHGEVAMAGTITRPQGAVGRLPAVVFVSGSGPQDRNGFSSGIDVGTHEILDRLTRDGLCVLRVDDRGVGSSTGPTEGMTFEDIVADARACVRFLRERDDVDPERIALIGHSEGGQVVPLVALAEPGIAAIALLAAPGRDLLTISREQFLAAKATEGATQAELAAYAQVVDGFLDAVRTESELDAAELPPELAVFLPARAWLASHAEQDPLGVLRRVTCPVLILQGEKDIQVSAERDAAALAATLEEVGHPDFRLVVLPGLDHLFKRTPGETSSGLDYLKDRRVDAALLDELSGWLRERLPEPN